MFNHTSLNNIHQLLTLLRQRPADIVVLKYMEGMEVREYTSGSVFEAIDACAACLQTLHLTGKHVGITGENRPEWLIHLCAIFQINAVPVLLSPDLNAQELAARILQTDIQHIVCDDDLMPVVQEAANITGISFQTMASYSSKPICFCLPCPEPAPEDMGCLFFTSGSTATPKAVSLSQKALVAGICHNVVGLDFESQLAILPMHHLAGFATVLNSWYLERTICLGAEYKYLFRYLEHMKPDYTSLVPSMLPAILRKLRKGGPNGHLLGWNLRYIGCGGAQFPPDVIETLNNNHIRILQGYGASEMGSIGFLREMTPDQSPSCIGIPPEGMDVKIEDQELFVRSPSLMTGYYRDAEATQQALRNGWYRTGDLAYIDEQGKIYLTGRRKNVIILSNGENVSPEEIELQLLRSPFIDEAIVGEEQDRIAAWIFTANADTDILKKIQAYIDSYNRQAPTYKHIHIVHYLDTPIPKNEAGKPLRHRVTGEITYDLTRNQRTDH